VAWIIGWDLILEYAIAAGTVSIGWSAYVVSFARDFGINIPSQFASAPFDFDSSTHTWSTTGAILNVPAIAIVVATTVLLVIGIRESSRFNDIIVAVKLVVIVLFVVLAAPAFSFSNWVTPPNAGTGMFGFSGVMRGAAVVFFAFIGFDAVSTVAQETKHPMRDLPIGIIG